MDSILTSIKKLLGIDEEYEHFDVDIIAHINSVMMTANQIGLGPVNGFIVTDKTQTWAQFLAPRTDITAVTTYFFLKVKLLFDPPQSSFAIESYKNQIVEMEWRLMHQAR